MNAGALEILKQMEEVEKRHQDQMANQSGGTIQEGIEYIRQFSNDLAQWIQGREHQIVVIHLGINNEKAQKRLAALLHLLSPHKSKAPE